MKALPDFMDKAMPIVGSPRLVAYDLMAGQAEEGAIMNDGTWNHGHSKRNPAQVPLAEISALLLTTPQRLNQKTSREHALDWLEPAKARLDANNHIRQCRKP